MLAVTSAEPFLDLKIAFLVTVHSQCFLFVLEGKTKNAVVKRSLLNGSAPIRLSFGLDLRIFGFGFSTFFCFLFIRLCFACVLNLTIFGEVCLFRQWRGQFIGFLVSADRTKVVFHEEVKERGLILIYKIYQKRILPDF
jgi:hypothetical protein